MSTNAIKGFPVNGGVAQYDFYSLANLPTAKAGQVLVVEGVDASGKITKIRATDFVVDRLDEITLPVANWTKVADEEYEQEFDVATVTANTYITTSADNATIKDLQERHLTLNAWNDGGKVVVTATGDKPEKDYTIEIKLEEVVRL